MLWLFNVLWKEARLFLQCLCSIEEEIAALKAEGKSTKGVTREKNKKVFNNHIRFFELVMKKWISDHPSQIDSFYRELHTLFIKVSEFHDISSKEWEM